MKQQPSGLGFYVPSAESGGRGLSQLASLLSSSRESAMENVIDHGSPYAKSLGFEAEIEWPVDALDDVPIHIPKKSRRKVHILIILLTTIVEEKFLHWRPYE